MSKARRKSQPPDPGRSVSAYLLAAAETLSPSPATPGPLDVQGAVIGLRDSFEAFLKMLDAGTVPVAGGDRRIVGVAHAVAISEESVRLTERIRTVQTLLLRRHGTPVRAGDLPFQVEESDSPDGPFEVIPGGEVFAFAMPIGGDGADARLLAALESAVSVVAFPTAKWNAMQARDPGGNHQRWHAGEVLPKTAIDTLESAKKMLALASEPQANSPAREPPLATDPPKPENRFVRDGVMWRVSFGGVSGTFRDLRGMHFIAQLLSRPNPQVPFAANELVKGHANVARATYTIQETLDPEAKREYEESLKSLRREREKAKKLQDDAAVARINGDIQAFCSELGQATGLGGRVRPLGPGSLEDRARTTVRMRIGDVYKIFNKATPSLSALADHLESSIRTEGCSYAYRPAERKIDWILQSPPS